MNNFKIDPNLKQTIDNFAWNQEFEKKPLPIDEKDFEKVIVEISNKILGAANIRPMLEMTAGQQFSLAEVCYLVVQSQEQKLNNPTILKNVEQVTPEARSILKNTFTRLSNDFIQVQSSDLKAITLLFGINRITELAKNSVTFRKELDPIQEMKLALTHLEGIRSKYNMDNLSEVEREFLLKIDAQIEEKKELLEALTLSLEISTLGVS
ncbi:MAG: hypothetical protein H0V82_02965 [Candidatus Protochlamydia sp.]|nr:hypothetical protein [Candidatus Protochlamydia sp.]